MGGCAGHDWEAGRRRPEWLLSRRKPAAGTVFLIMLSPLCLERRETAVLCEQIYMRFQYSIIICSRPMTTRERNHNIRIPWPAAVACPGASPHDPISYFSS